MDTTICPTCGHEVTIDKYGIGLCERDRQYVKAVDDRGGVIATSTDVLKAHEKEYKQKKNR